MQINATTLVQICNFWITYFFLQKFIFKPIVTMLLQKEAFRKASRDDLKYKETALLQLQEKKLRQITDFRKQIAQTYQFTPHQVPEIPSGVIYQPNEEKISELTNTITDLLTEKVPHAF